MRGLDVHFGRRRLFLFLATDRKQKTSAENNGGSPEEARAKGGKRS
jgi:hypothetical protein